LYLSILSLGITFYTFNPNITLAKTKKKNNKVKFGRKVSALLKLRGPFFLYTHKTIV